MTFFHPLYCIPVKKESSEELLIAVNGNSNCNITNDTKMRRDSEMCWHIRRCLENPSESRSILYMDFSVGCKIYFFGWYHVWRVLENISLFHGKYFIITPIHCAKINETFSQPSKSPSRNIDGRQIDFPKYLHRPPRSFKKFHFWNHSNRRYSWYPQPNLLPYLSSLHE